MLKEHVRTFIKDVGIFASIALVLITFTALSFVACTDESATKETLRKSGYTEIQTTGYKAFSCSDSDSFSTGFRAKNPKGEVVEGVVCCGLMKSCTVRF